jgi:hypothetical protein
MAGGLAKLPSRPGDDLFLAVTDLVAAGGRTAVVSRWRMGGKTSVDLVEEFLRDRELVGADAPPASESWQRAVEMAMAEQPDMGREPRLKQSPQTVLTDAGHPLLWSGYLLVDCGVGRYADPIQEGPGQPERSAQPATPVPPPAAANEPAPPTATPRGPLNPALPRQNQ